MNFNDLIKKRHSVRNYKNEIVEDELLKKIIAAAELAPTSRNKKPCIFISVTDKKILESLAESKAGGSQMLKDAGAAIVVAGDSEKSDVWIEDCSIAMTYMHLKAVDLGLGSCWIQLRNRKTKDEIDSVEYVKKLLNLENKYQVLAILSLGKI